MTCATLKRPVDFDNTLINPNPPKRRRCHFCDSSPSSRFPSSFPDNLPKWTTEYLTENIKMELTRMRTRKQLSYNALEAEFPPGPIFTFRQVVLICERILSEREREIKEEYDGVLSSKLAEQYEVFVKFINDQLRRNLTSGVPSYLS